MLEFLWSFVKSVVTLVLIITILVVIAWAAAVAGRGKGISCPDANLDPAFCRTHHSDPKMVFKKTFWGDVDVYYDGVRVMRCTYDEACGTFVICQEEPK